MVVGGGKNEVKKAIQQKKVVCKKMCVNRLEEQGLMKEYEKSNKNVVVHIHTFFSKFFYYKNVVANSMKKDAEK